VAQSEGHEELIRKREDDVTPGATFGVSPWDGSSINWSSSLGGSDGEDSGEADSTSPPPLPSVVMPIREYPVIRADASSSDNSSPQDGGTNWRIQDENFPRG
jgi:hypothetical protein